MAIKNTAKSTKGSANHTPNKPNTFGSIITAGTNKITCLNITNNPADLPSPMA